MADPGETAWLDELQVCITVGDTSMAQLAVWHFAVAARDEWARFAGVDGSNLRGMA